jgi:hypothetical protein
VLRCRARADAAVAEENERLGREADNSRREAAKLSSQLDESVRSTVEKGVGRGGMKLMRGGDCRCATRRSCADDSGGATTNQSVGRRRGAWQSWRPRCALSRPPFRPVAPCCCDTLQRASQAHLLVAAADTLAGVPPHQVATLSKALQSGESPEMAQLLEKEKARATQLAAEVDAMRKDLSAFDPVRVHTTTRGHYSRASACLQRLAMPPSSRQAGWGHLRADRPVRCCLPGVFRGAGGPQVRLRAGEGT